jgi:hypothetical protein
VDSSDERQRTVSRRSDNVKLAGSVLRGIEEPGLFTAGHLDRRFTLLRRLE